MTARRSPHQRSLAAEALTGIHFGARLQQQFSRLDIAGAGHQMQRRFTIGVCRIRIRAGFQQQADKFGIGGIRGQLHGVDAIGIGGLHISASRQQLLRMGNVRL